LRTHASAEGAADTSFFTNTENAIAGCECTGRLLNTSSGPDNADEGDTHEWLLGPFSVRGSRGTGSWCA